MPAATPGARLEARISTELHAMLKRAAELQGRTMTDFAVVAVQEAAQQAIQQAEVVRLSLADQACLAEALLSPPARCVAVCASAHPAGIAAQPTVQRRHDPLAESQGRLDACFHRWPLSRSDHGSPDEP